VACFCFRLPSGWGLVPALTGLTTAAHGRRRWEGQCVGRVWHSDLAWGGLTRSACISQISEGPSEGQIRGLRSQIASPSLVCFVHLCAGEHLFMEWLHLSQPLVCR
jgi:hypothetical protein